MRKYWIIAALVAAIFIPFGCSSIYDDQLDEMRDRIEHLKAEDQLTREIVAEIDRLSEDILAQLADMEENVLDNLDQTVAKLEDLILENTMQTRKAIRIASNKAGCDIDAWTARLNHLTDKSADTFSQSLEIMKDEMEKARQLGDLVQMQRINNAIGKIEWMQNNLSGLIEQTQTRISSLEGLEKKYSEINKQLSLLMDRKKNMLVLIDSYEAQFRDVISANLENWESKDLGDFSQELYAMYVKMQGMREEIIEMTSQVQDNLDNMPDIESALDDAQSLVDTMYDMESLIDDFDLSSIDDIISELNFAMGYASTGEFTIDELSDKFDSYDAVASEMLYSFYDWEAQLDEMWDFLDDAVCTLEDYISDIS